MILKYKSEALELYLHKKVARFFIKHKELFENKLVEVYEHDKKAHIIKLSANSFYA